MGLRINTNINAVTALFNLREADRLQSGSLGRLATGLRITKAADDPAGLVISEQLRAQVGGLRQAVENTEFSSNLISTGEGGLIEVNNLLNRIRQSAIFAKNSGGISDEQIEAEQDAVDSAIASIDRIAATTRFGRTNLLNGASDFNTTSVGANVNELRLRRVFFGTASSQLFTINVTAAASQATLSIGVMCAAGGTLRITGIKGSEEVTFAAAASAGGGIRAAINQVREFTGVFASGGRVFSEGFGTDEFVTVARVTGTYNGAAVAGTDFGRDVTAVIAGATIDVQGRSLIINSVFLQAELTLSSGTGAGATNQFRVVANSGLDFQLGGEPSANDLITVGIQSVRASELGKPTELTPGAAGTGGARTIFGFLDSLVSGGANDLKGDTTNAIRIVDSAIDQVNGLRGFLGAVESDTLQPNARSLGVAIENLVASESEIRDLDFAAETAEFTRAQVLFAAGTSVLASANVIPQTVLSLLQ